MRSGARAAGLSAITFALAGLASFAFQVAPPMLGFDDTDNPAVSLSFVRAHPDINVFAGLSLILMAIALVVTILGVADVVVPRAESLAMRCASTFGLFAAALFLVTGGLRIGASGPLLHIAGLRDDWGETAYLAFNVAGQAAGITAIVGLCLWAIGLSLIGRRRSVLPLWLCVLGIIPAFRLLGALLVHWASCRIPSSCGSSAWSRSRGRWCGASCSAWFSCVAGPGLRGSGAWCL